MRAARTGAVLLALLTAGCGGPSYTPEPYAGPAAPASADPPIRPAAATGATVSAAKAFVTYWIEVLDWSQTHGETLTLRTLSAPTCARCTSLADDLDQVREAGGTVATDGWTVLGLQLDPVSPDRPRVLADVRIDPQTVAPEAGATAHTVTGDPATTRVFDLVRGDGGWVVADLTSP